jgi:hypothetical protein
MAHLSIQGEKSMAMKLVKKTDEYSIFLRSDKRYAVKDANKAPINGDDKVRILVEEGLIKAAVPAAPAEEAAPEEPSAEEAPVEEEAPAEEAPAEEAPAEEAPAEAEDAPAEDDEDK